MKLTEVVKSNNEQMIAHIMDILKIRSVKDTPQEGMPYGKGISKVLNEALRISEELGFKTVDVDGEVGYAEYGEGEDYVAVLGHLDVVPEGEGWNTPPYEPTVIDGKIYARGALDNKGPVISSLYGLKAIKDCQLPLTKRVRVIFGTNEESGVEDIHHYLSKEKPPVSGFTPDGKFPIVYAEKGLMTFTLTQQLEDNHPVYNITNIQAGMKSNVVPEKCEATLMTNDIKSFKQKFDEYIVKTDDCMEYVIEGGTIHLISYGKAAHASKPHLGKNAIMIMFLFLNELLKGNGSIGSYIAKMNEVIGKDTTGQQLGIACKDEPSGSLTLNVGIMRSCGKSIQMKCNVRYPVTEDSEWIIMRIKEKFAGTDIRYEQSSHNKPLFFDRTHPMIKKLQKAYEEQTGFEAELLSTGGGTYAKLMPNIVAFGPTFPGSPDVAHRANEYVEIDLLKKCANIYAHAIYELAK